MVDYLLSMVKEVVKPAEAVVHTPASGSDQDKSSVIREIEYKRKQALEPPCEAPNASQTHLGLECLTRSWEFQNVAIGPLRDMPRVWEP
jgi:hypothetical protein